MWGIIPLAYLEISGRGKLYFLVYRYLLDRPDILSVLLSEHCVPVCPFNISVEMQYCGPCFSIHHCHLRAINDKLPCITVRVFDMPGPASVQNYREKHFLICSLIRSFASRWWIQRFYFHSIDLCFFIIISSQLCSFSFSVLLFLILLCNFKSFRTQNILCTILQTLQACSADIALVQLRLSNPSFMSLLVYEERNIVHCSVEARKSIQEFFY